MVSFPLKRSDKLIKVKGLRINIILLFVFFACSKNNSSENSPGIDEILESFEEYSQESSHSSDYIYDQNKLHRFDLYLSELNLDKIDSAPTDEKYVEFWDGGAWKQIDTDAPLNNTGNFSIVEYAGNSQTDRDITGVGFDPDLTIVKNKGAGESWGWGDTVRGGGYIIYSNLSNGQTGSAYVTPSAVTDGFKISTGNNNYVGNNYIAYNFKAGGAPTATNSAGAGNVPTSGSVMIDGSASSAALAGTLEAKYLLTLILNLVLYNILGVLEHYRIYWESLLE